ncbi:MAG: radical SAM protein [Bryobacteraceae bacterium]|nr:radical SAM protein [Bryobacteraceae bacterium]
MRRDVEVPSAPYSLFVDPTNVCNLRCPFCATGAGELNRELRGLMPVPLFKKVIDEIGDRLYMVFLFNWGEPFLHSGICEMIRYAHERRIYTCVHTNFSLRWGEAGAEKIVDSGLSFLNVSADGVSQDVYSVYRRGGNIERVLGNVRALVEVKRRRRSSRPYLVWRYVAFKHNEHEIEPARKLAGELGVDEFRVIRGFVRDPAWRATGQYPNVTSQDMPETCGWLWRSIVINVDGGVGSCCYQRVQSDDFGSIRDSSLMSVWNNEQYRAARSYLARQQKRRRSVPAESEEEADIICARCPAVTSTLSYDESPAGAGESGPDVPIAGIRSAGG